MIPTPMADVIVPWERHLGSVLECVESVLEYGGPTLRRVVLVGDPIADRGTAAALRWLAVVDSRLEIIENTGAMGFAECCNHALAQREGDALILRGDCAVTRDSLLELAAVAHSDERTACASPLVNGGGSCSVPELFAETCSFALDDAAVRAACAGLPKWTVAPLLTASCTYLRGDVIDAVGVLDDGFYSPSAVINNWVLRAQALGFLSKRANHAYVCRVRLSGDGEEPDLDLGACLSEMEHGEHLRHQIGAFRATLDGSLAAHAVRLEAKRKLRVAYDIRHLPREQTGTRTYAVSLAKALAGLGGLELTLVVRDPAQAQGIPGRVVTASEWQDDVEVIHKPAQVMSTPELELLFGSSAHFVVTYQDLIGYQIPRVFPDDLSFERYRSTSCLILPAAQRVVAYSRVAADEISAEFGIPNHEIAVVPLGVEAESFSRHEPGDRTIPWKLRLPRRYFFSLATDFPHKNISGLLDAYAILRRRWGRGQPPALLLAGYRTDGRDCIYQELGNRRLPHGVRFLGPVSGDQLRVLYQRALAFVFPSLYEGFGLPPLESMAAGTPVIAMPISAVPEVADGCVLHPDGLSADSLARSMELIASDEALRGMLRSSGLKRAEQSRWSDTALATLEVYRSTVLRPSARSLQARRLLRDAVIRWAADRPSATRAEATAPIRAVEPEEPLGIRGAWRALNVAISARLRREAVRMQRAVGARSSGKRSANLAREKSLSA